MHPNKIHGLDSLKHFNPETRVLKMPVADAAELLLFITFLAAALGVIFREGFLYAVFGMIVLLILIEGYRRRKESVKLEDRIDRAILEKRKEAGIKD